ncbi:MAG: hypothetical protein JHC95_18025 [Solirubrobacteraceae bacterium]|nr:hypothetical protein [Solirubrobacteraceae bacterium]
MHTFAHSLSHPLARRESGSSDTPQNVDTVIVLLVAAIVALLIAGGLVYSSMNAQIENLQTSRVAAQQEGVQSDAFSACVANHKAGAGVTSRCRTAAATFAANDPDSGAFDRAVAYIYPR